MFLLYTSQQYFTLSNSKQVRKDLLNDRRHASMSSSQLAPLVRFPSGIIDLPWAAWAGLGLWNLCGRPGGETLDLELHPAVTLLKKQQHAKSEGEECHNESMSICLHMRCEICTAPFNPSNLKKHTHYCTNVAIYVILRRKNKAIVWIYETPWNLLFTVLISFLQLGEIPVDCGHPV